MRLQGKAKMGYYPTPDRVVDIIRARVKLPDEPFAVIDPCCGEGLALARFAEGSAAVTYGVEPDNTRSNEAESRLDNVLHCPIEATRISNKAFSVLYLNPPYDWEYEDDGEKCVRKEVKFFNRSVRWLAPGGLLVFIIPESIWNSNLADTIKHKFQTLEAWRFPNPEYEDFGQIVILGIRKEWDCYSYGRFDLEDYSDDITYRMRYIVPRSNPDVPLFMATAFSPDYCARLVEKSVLWSRFREANQSRSGDMTAKRPPLPLHSGHLTLTLASGVLDGIVGEGPDAHVVKGKVKKVQLTDMKSTVSEDGTETTTTIIKDKHQVSIKLLTRDGEIREVA